MDLFLKVPLIISEWKCLLLVQLALHIVVSGKQWTLFNATPTVSVFLFVLICLLYSNKKYITLTNQ